MLPDLGCKHALLLQGPAGPFFGRFRRELLDAGIRVTKINFHPGDVLFHPWPGSVSYRGTLEEFPDFVRELIRERGIDAIFLFGDGRPYHRRAIEVARELGVAVWVFEEGYLRPDYITLERGGVNGFSSLPRDPEHYRRWARENGAPPIEAPLSVGDSFTPSAIYSTVNAIAFTLLKPAFPHYEHHRSLNFVRHTGWWVRGGARKAIFRARERDVLDELVQNRSKRYFFVPLQVHCDFQLLHSPYADVTEFVEEIVAAFARDADPADSLVLKHHPMDRAYRDYSLLMRRLARRHRLGDRLVYVHDLHLPTLLEHAKGTITINSTVGLSSIHHGTPVKVMGTAIYDMPGLTHQGSLAHFLHHPGAVDHELYEAFRAYLLVHNQANGSVWRRIPGRRRGTGVRWFPGGNGG